MGVVEEGGRKEGSHKEEDRCQEMETKGREKVEGRRGEGPDIEEEDEDEERRQTTVMRPARVVALLH